MWTFTTGTTDGLASGVVADALDVLQDAADYWSRYIDFGGNTLDIRVNFSSLGATTLAQASTAFYSTGSFGGSVLFQAATILELTDNFDINGALPDIEIDINSDSLRDNEFWLGGIGSPNVPFEKFDLFTVLVHEIGHGLGIVAFEEGPGGDVSVYETFINTIGANSFFAGPNAKAVFGGDVPLAEDQSHLSSSFLDVMNASLFNGQRLFVTPLDVAILTDSGLPFLTPTNGADTLYGFEKESGDLTFMFGDDFISLLGGDDEYFGLSGADTIDGGPGNDTLGGGRGDDVLYGRDGHDEIYGNEDDDAANGGDGDDHIVGQSGNDLLVGASGNDTITGDAGQDIIYGGAGNDNLSGGSSGDFISGGVNNDILAGGDGNDELAGGANNDSVMGGNGDDTIYGAKKVDTLEGGEGDDIVSGAADNDFIDGNSGNDTLFGGRQNDLITGGPGNDLFLYNKGGDYDVITDFTAGAGTEDVIQLNNFGAAFDSLAEIVAAATDDGTDTVINFGDGDIIILHGVLVADLHESDFAFG